MKRNRGITIIELIIVVAIIGILLGGVALTFSIVNSADIQGCTQTLDSSLERTKNECMSKTEQHYLILYKSAISEHSGYYVKTVCSTELTSYTPIPHMDTRIGSDKIKISATLESGASVEVTDTAVYFTFDRATGAFGYLYSGIPAASTGDYPSFITITNGKKTSIINCIQATGKHFIE